MSAGRAGAEPSTGWMLGMSTWMVSALIPGSFLSWLGFLIVGIVGRMLRWTIVGVVLGALAIVVALPVWGQWQPLLAAILYIAGMLLALMANPSWLRAMWARRTGENAQEPRKTSASRTSSSRSSSRGASRSRREGQKANAASSQRDEPRVGSSFTASASHDTAHDAGGAGESGAVGNPSAADGLAARAGASSAEFFAAGDAAEPIDVNTADAGELANLPGITARQARRLVKQRSAQGGFTSLDAFATAARLQPHELVRLRDAAVCSRPARGPRRFGRRVDY